MDRLSLNLQPSFISHEHRTRNEWVTKSETSGSDRQKSDFFAFSSKWNITRGKIPLIWSSSCSKFFVLANILETLWTTFSISLNLLPHSLVFRWEVHFFHFPWPIPVKSVPKRRRKKFQFTRLHTIMQIMQTDRNRFIKPFWQCSMWNDIQPHYESTVADNNGAQWLKIVSKNEMPCKCTNLFSAVLNDTI